MRTVSVIIPSYNSAALLEEALASVAAQTYPHRELEVLVIDDGSSDDTADRVAAFAERESIATRYVYQRNAGPAAARNRGLRLAKGSVIAFLDADDRWEPTKLERQVPLIDGRVALVYCDSSFCDAHGRPIADYVRRVQLHRGDILLPLFCNHFLMTPAVILDRAAAMAVGFFDESLPVGEDYEYFLRFAQRYEADYVAEKLFVRSVRPGSLSRRDYALDARVDLATLIGFARAHRDFARRHRSAVNRRIAECHYDFAYRLLADNRRREAIAELLRSLARRPGVNSARTLLRALLPPLVVRAVRAQG